MDNLAALQAPPLRAAELRRHTALVRALLDELDRIVPSPHASSREDALEQQLIEELRRLACLILASTGESTATTTHASAAPSPRDPEPQHPRLARTRASEPAPGFAALTLPAPSGGE
jgi:hypothetical protein